jgi:hypothetical protein
MRYLKPILESLSFKDYFDQLSEKTGVGEIKQEIDELFLDLKDNFTNVYLTKDLSIHLEYKSKNKRKSSVGYTYYLDILNKGHNPFATDFLHLKSFLDKCEIATNMKMEYWVALTEVFTSPDQVDQFKEDVESIMIRGESIGYDVSISRNRAKGDELNTPGLIFNSDTLRQTSWENYRMSCYLLFETSLDKEKFKPNTNLISQIPSNIISDFEAFTNRYRMPSRDKQELINIIKKGDWSA